MDERAARARQHVAVADAMAEFELLARKGRLTPAERRQFDVLKQRIALLREGYQLEEVQVVELNEIERRSDLPLTPQRASALTPAQKEEARSWVAAIRAAVRDEQRAGLTGTPAVQPGQLGGGVGTFVPVEYFKTELPRTFATISPLLDGDRVTLLKSDNGRPLEVPFLSDINNVAVAISEATQDAPVDLQKTGAKFVNAFNYRSPYYVASFEALQDLAESFNLVEMFKVFAAERLARGIGKDFILGNGVGKPNGLLAQLSAAGSPVTVAAGSFANTGNAPDTGANTIGLADVSKLYTSVPAVYRKSKKAAWIMSDSTLQFLRGLVGKQGQAVFPLEAHPDDPSSEGTLFGKNIYIDLNMPNIAASATTIVFGDLSYVLSRYVMGSGYVRAYTNFPGLAEQGKFALRAFVRADMLLKVGDSSFAGIGVLQQHS